MTQIRPQARDAIIEAAFQVFGTSPRASLGDIAERAGVGRATLHRHFKGRDDLMAALAHTAMAELEAAVAHAVKDAASYTEALRLSMQAIVPLADRQWFLAIEASVAANDDAGHQREVTEGHIRQMRELADAIDGAKAEGLFGQDIPTAWIVEAFDNLLYAAWQLVRSGNATPTQASAFAWRTLTTGLGGTTGDK